MPNKPRFTVKKLHVTLGIKCDGPVPGPVPDSLGQVTAGPMGFLSVLETQLGIPASEVSFTARLIQYLACLDQVNNRDRFYHDSFTADPFSVARTLLQWRDQWHLAGWTGTFSDDVPTRLSDMAAVEQQAASSVEPGLGQRVQHVIALLAGNPIAVQSICLHDALSDFPFLWQQLIQAVNAPVSDESDLSPQADEGSDLGRLQRQLARGSSQPIELSGDGSLVVITADSAQETTPIVACLTQNRLTRSGGKSVAILADSRGELLDEALQAVGNPRLGFNALSPWRPVLQVLPLACELLWKPLSPTALFQFLSHPMAPIPARIREKLAQTVAAVPGIGSTAWESTLEQCLARENENSRNRQRDNLRFWLESARFSPQSGVDSATLSNRAQRVADWLMGVTETTADSSLKSLYFIALNQALEFIKAVERLKSHGRETLTRDHVLRLIEDVRGNGSALTDRQAEVCPGQNRVFRAEHAGAFYFPMDQVIWWDCQASDPIHRWPWSRAERTALANNGVFLQSEDAQLEWLGKAWLRPVLSTREQCTIVLHRDAERHHPIWDQIACLAKNHPQLSVADADTIDLLEIPQDTLQSRQLPQTYRWWQLDNDIDIPKRAFESYSSLNAFIYSPYQWLLRYSAGIRPGSVATVNDGNLLKGNLAHRLFEEFFNTHTNIVEVAPDDIPRWVDQHMPTLLQQQGASLLEPGRQAECERLITDLQQSLKVLTEHMQRAGVVQVEMERWQQGQFTGGKLNGSIDLLVTCADGREAIVDIKLGGKKYRRDTLLAGNYLQLATYAQLRRAAGVKTTPALSYFIVSDAQLLSLDHDFFSQAERITPQSQENWRQFWRRFEHTWHWRRDQLDRGRIEVTITGTEPDADSSPGEQGLVLPAASDSFNDFRVITGWEPDS